MLISHPQTRGPRALLLKHEIDGVTSAVTESVQIMYSTDVPIHHITLTSSPNFRYTPQIG
jgi:hypothetical protein